MEASVALDWSPNTNHTGFYVARAKGFYKEAGFASVGIRSPHEDSYKSTPASHVADGSATFACVPSESVISYHTWPDAAKPKIVAVAALLQSNLSAIVTLESSGIDRPAKLDGKKYASYAARYEGRIVQEVIRADGGSGTYTELTPPMLGIWNTLLDGSADATWVFMPWEGVAAQQAGVKLNTFKLEDYGIPYCYSPVLAAHPDTLSRHPDMVRSFLAATAKGFAWAAQNPAEAAQILVEEVAADAEASGKPLPTPLEPEMVLQSQQEISPHYLHLDSKAWGVMDLQRWSQFLDWLSNKGLLTSKVQSRHGGTAASAAPATTSTSSGGTAVTAGTSSTSSITTLDGLRGGDSGDRIPRSSVKADDLATNVFLPQ